MRFSDQSYLSVQCELFPNSLSLTHTQSTYIRIEYPIPFYSYTVIPLLSMSDPDPALNPRSSDSDVDSADDSPLTLSSDLLSLLSPEARAALEQHKIEKAEQEEKLKKAQADGTTEIGEDFGMSQVRKRENRERTNERAKKRNYQWRA